ncbi:MAG: sulfite exporter TauE/SafE family protein [Gammaproteobacteria bacterium]|nr:sulfite exporter TauE/SafE family protein [Gammaproteobacteria bacterium]
MTESLYISAFMVGLLGGTHCAGMCGGIVSAITMGLPQGIRHNSNHLTLYLLLYNIGRVLSYTLAGLLVASLTIGLVSIADSMVIREAFTIIAALMMILLGFYLSGWWPKAINKIERLGFYLWNFIKPLAQKFIPIQTPTHALFAGFLWGWLPCGLVYTALIWAMSAETVIQGGLVMASFGLGTLPTLIGIGFFSSTLVRYIQQQWVRTSAGVMMICFGVYQLILL